jgi:hypothetical protein
MEEDTHSFIIRIWNAAEDRPGKPSAWRGSIDYVGNDKRLYFTDINSVVGFIHEQVDSMSRTSSSSWGFFKDYVNRAWKSVFGGRK